MSRLHEISSESKVAIRFSMGMQGIITYFRLLEKEGF